MKRLAIITDDLTSAMDCGIQIARSGMDVLVIIGEYRSRPNLHRSGAISVDTNTRSVSANEAYGTVKEVASNIRADGYENIYKSVDSTLRGNLGAEIDAVMDVYSFDFSVVAPAFPHYMRTTVNGKHFLKGVPLAQTEFANDPKNPVNEDSLIKLLSSQSRRNVGLVRLPILRRGFNDVSEQIEFLRSRGTELIVFDVQVEEDLDRIVRAVSKTGYSVLWVGSTGLARCIPKTINFQTEKRPAKPLPSGRHHTILVSGSTSETTNEQLSILKMQTEISAVEVRPLEIVRGAQSVKREIRRCCSLLVNALRQGNDIALHVPTSREEVAKAMLLGHRMGMVDTQISSRISKALAKISKQIIEGFDLRGLILIGGDTAKAVCNELGGIAIQILKEVEPGVPLGHLIGATELLVITKAGAFGTAHVLVDSLKTLSRS